MAMFTKEEAVSFLQTKWGMKRVEERLLDDRKALLDEIAILVQAKVPFQSITLMAVPLVDRKRPSVTTIKEDCMAGVGGLCYNVNVFTWGLLQALGFSAQLCSATCTSTISSPDNHVLVLINDLEKKGDLHIVECGAGFPTFRAISLDFAEESPVYVDSFLEYKYIRHEGQFLRMHGKGDKVKRNSPPIDGLDFIVGNWRRFYFFSLRPKESLSDFDATFDEVFTVPSTTPFHRSPRALCFPNQRAVILVNNQLMVEKEDGQLETTPLEGDEQIVDSYRRYFTVLGEDTVRSALKHWHSVQQ